MNLVYQAETWPDVVEEITPLLKLQWEELALDKEDIPYDPDWDRYSRLHKEGIFKITTVRDNRKLVGWYFTFVCPHLHYKSSIFAFVDVYYLLPEYRKGSIGVKLFTEMESQMRELGVIEMISISKNHIDTSSLFDRLKWRFTGKTYTKVLK